MASVHRIKIKLGADEFEAEGAEDKVQAQYQQFLDARGLKAATPARATERSSDGPATVTDALMAQIFELRPDDVVVLRVQPPSGTEPADKVALLLYGYRRLKNAQNVLATQILRAAALSGLGIPRIDRAVASYIPQFILRGGQRKGTTYTLTTQGVTKAEDLAASLFG